MKAEVDLPERAQQRLETGVLRRTVVQRDLLRSEAARTPVRAALGSALYKLFLRSAATLKLTFFPAGIWIFQRAVP